MLIPNGPNDGPNGGPGVALPPGIKAFTILVIALFLLLIYIKSLHIFKDYIFSSFFNTLTVSYFNVIGIGTTASNNSTVISSC